ncbi:MAG TPA: RNA polymerase sigma factor [Candidatus Elarobacter sp.]|jgi:RNA polymerase sigma-70 factor (ECF subfamily)
MDVGSDVAAAAAGDEAALSAVLERSWTWAFRFAWRVLRDRQAAEDVAQEACIAALRSLGALREAATYQAWFRRVVIRIALRHRRTTVPEPIADLDLAAVTPDVDDALDVNAAIDALSEPLRIAVLLFYAFDLPSAEIADALRIPDGTVRWRLAEGRRQLRGLLSGTAPNERIAR